MKVATMAEKDAIEVYRPFPNEFMVNIKSRVSERRIIQDVLVG